MIHNVNDPNTNAKPKSFPVPHVALQKRGGGHGHKWKEEAFGCRFATMCTSYSHSLMSGVIFSFFFAASWTPHANREGKIIHWHSSSLKRKVTVGQEECHHEDRELFCIYSHWSLLLWSLFTKGITLVRDQWVKTPSLLSLWLPPCGHFGRVTSLLKNIIKRKEKVMSIRNDRTSGSEWRDITAAMWGRSFQVFFFAAIMRSGYR